MSKNNIQENVEPNNMKMPVENEMKEVIIGIPPNTAMMKVSVLLVKENGETEEQIGQFDFEQILMSRIKYMQLIDKINNLTGDEKDEERKAEAQSEGETETPSKEEI